MTKYCKRCDTVHSISNFTPNNSRYDGLQGYCTECMKTYRREHYQANKKSYIDRSIKTKQEIREYVRIVKSNPCSDCNVSYPSEPWLMEFDHLDNSTKVMEISRLISKGSLKNVIAEISKCDLVCVICHRRRSASRGKWYTDIDLEL